MAPRRRTLSIAAALVLIAVFLLAHSRSGGATGHPAERDGVAAARRARTSATQGEPRELTKAALAILPHGSDPAVEARIENERLASERALHLTLQRKQRTELETSLMRAIEQSSRYPASNQRFPTEAYDPVVRERAPDRRERRSPDGRTLLTVWTGQKQYDLGSPVTVHALVQTAHEPDGKATAVETDLAVVLFGGHGKTLVESAMHDEGGGRHGTTLRLANGVLDEGFYAGRVTTEAGLSQSFAFVVRPAYARLTGGYRDRLESGHLLVELEIDAFEDGDYYVFGSLYADDGVPIGTAEVTQRLSAGASWVSLRFFGRLVHDGGRDGPFRFAHVSVAKKTFPMSQGVDADPDYWTAPHALQGLDAAPYSRLSTVD